MREDEILAKLVTELRAIVPSDYDVRVEGDDQKPEPPEVIIEWNATRDPNLPGHRTHAGNNYDQNGVAQTREHHLYSRMEADCIIRAFDDIDKDIVADDVQMGFLPYEDNSDAFDADTFQWEVAAPSPRNNPFVENDWYQSGVVLSFGYVKRDTETGDTIEDIQYDVEIDETLSE
jgi:hypothetical protein